jgi:hypothetical protein
MVDQLADKIIKSIGQADQKYHRLILLVATSGAGKTAALKETEKRIGAPIININLELSRRLLDLTKKQRRSDSSKIVSDMINEFESNIILLDNIEVIFDTSLKQDPLLFLQHLSRNKTIVAAWNGDIQGDYLYYAKSGHSEFKKYPLEDLLIVTPKTEQ